MCGRFTLTYRERVRLAEEMGVLVEQVPPDYRPRYNIAPTDSHLILRKRYEDLEVLTAKWGLVNSWATDAKRAAAQINARAESLARLPAFREAFQKRRCLVPADGFFEWTGDKALRRPIWFHRLEGGLLYFAGLYESWQRQPGEWERTFTIVTTTPNSLIAPIHDRMPVILPEEAIDEWLFGSDDQERLLGMLAPAAESVLVATPVSRRANSVQNDDPECLIEEAMLL